MNEILLAAGIPFAQMLGLLALGLLLRVNRKTEGDE